MTLYELTSEYMAVLEMMDDPEVDPQTVTDTLEAIGGELEDKADGYAKVIANADATLNGLKSEIERLTNRKRSIEANIKRMKESLQAAMVATGKTKFKTALFNFRIQKNPAAVSIENEALIPKKYFIPQDPKLDKKTILELLKSGKKVKGCELTQGESLRIS